MKIRKAVIPAAGLGTRFLPATKSLAKEMLPIVDKPCIHYLVEEAVLSGIKEIIIITGRGKRSIEDYFDHSFELNANLEKNKKTALLKEMEKIEKMAKIFYVRQDFPRGDGHAILCAKELIENEPFAVLFGDDIYDSKTPALAQMIKQYEQLRTPIVALQKINKKDSDKYGMVEIEKTIERLHKIKGLVEKPLPQNSPSSYGIIGKYIVTPELLKSLQKVKKTDSSEIRLIDGMIDYIRTSPIYGYELEGERFDTGDKLGYLKAVVHFALKHKDLRKDFKAYLQDLDFN